MMKLKTTKKKVTILLKEMMEALASMAKAKSLSLSLQTRISALKLRLMVFSLLRDRRFQVGTIPNNLHSLLHRRRNHHHRNHHNKLEQQQQQQMIQIHDDEPQFHGGDEGEKRVVLFYCDDGDSGKSEASVLVNCDDDGGKSEASVNCDDGDGGKFDAGGSDLAEAEANRVDSEAEEEEEEVNPVSEEWLEEAAVATAAELGEEALEEEEAEKLLDELEFVVEGGGGDSCSVADKVFDEMKLEETESDHDGGGGGGGGGGGDWLRKLAVEKEEEEEFELEDKIDEVADLFIKRFHEQMRMERSPIHQ